MSENTKCEALTKDSEGYFTGDECGKDVTLIIKFNQSEWPMNFGTVGFCDTHRKVIWDSLKDLVDM